MFPTPEDIIEGLRSENRHLRFQLACMTGDLKTLQELGKDLPPEFLEKAKEKVDEFHKPLISSKEEQDFINTFLDAMKSMELQMTDVNGEPFHSVVCNYHTSYKRGDTSCNCGMTQLFRLRDRLLLQRAQIHPRG